jgi:hypothetical protein
MGILFMGAWLSQCMERHAKRICEAIPKTALSPEQVAIVRVEGDEAIAAITGARLAGIFADLIWRVSGAKAVKAINEMLTIWDYAGIRSIQEIAKRSAEQSAEMKGMGELSWCPQDHAYSWAKEVRAIIFQAVAIGAVGIFQEGTPNEKFWTMILFGVYGLPAALAVASVAIGIPFALLSSMSLLPCGLTVPFAGPYLHMTAEPLPPGSWTVTQFDITGDHPKSLFHSEAYEHPLVPWCLADWIKERVKGKES